MRAVEVPRRFHGPAKQCSGAEQTSSDSISRQAICGSRQAVGFRAWGETWGVQPSPSRQLTLRRAAANSTCLRHYPDHYAPTTYVNVSQKTWSVACGGGVSSNYVQSQRLRRQIAERNLLPRRPRRRDRRALG